MKIRFRNIYYLLFCILGIYFLFSSLKYTQKAYNHTNPIDFSKDWKLSIEGKNINEVIDLPYLTKENTTENIISIEKKIPNYFIKNPSLRLGSSQQQVDIYLNNQLIYSFDSMRAINNGKTGGASWLLVDLPDDCFGKTLKIEFTSTYKNLSGTLSIVKFGNKSVLLSELFLETFPDGLLSLALFIFAILFLVLSIYYKKFYNINFYGYYISFMFLLVSIWILAESQFFIFIFNNYSFFYFLQFMSLFLFPIILYKYIYLKYNLKKRKIILILYKLHFYLLHILMLLQFIGFIPFYSSQWIFILFFLLTLFICISIIIPELSEHNTLKKLINILIILFLSFILETFIYDFKSYIFDINFLSLGILLIELYIFISILKNISELKKIKDANNLLKLQLDYQLKYYNTLKEKSSDLKSYKHDMINHLSTVYNLLNNNNIDESEIYISKMINTFSKKNKSIIDTGNPVLDSILTEKIEIANKKNIKIKNSIFINSNLKIDLLDFCIIFSNLLDNAIEAASKCQNKYIEINLLSKNNMLICKIANSIDENIKINKDFKTTKKDNSSHGIGLKNIKNAIHNYNGELSINYDKHNFIVSFILFDV